MKQILIAVLQILRDDGIVARGVTEYGHDRLIIGGYEGLGGYLSTFITIDGDDIVIKASTRIIPGPGLVNMMKIPIADPDCFKKLKELLK